MRRLPLLLAVLLCATPSAAYALGHGGHQGGAACPSTGKIHGACPGYVVDRIQALKQGGRDDPSIMQRQTSQPAKAKDRWE